MTRATVDISNKPPRPQNNEINPHGPSNLHNSIKSNKLVVGHTWQRRTGFVFFMFITFVVFWWVMLGGIWWVDLIFGGHVGRRKERVVTPVSYQHSLGQENAEEHCRHTTHYHNAPKTCLKIKSVNFCLEYFVDKSGTRMRNTEIFRGRVNKIELIF